MGFTASVIWTWISYLVELRMYSGITITYNGFVRSISQCLASTQIWLEAFSFWHVTWFWLEMSKEEEEEEEGRNSSEREKETYLKYIEHMISSSIDPYRPSIQLPLHENLDKPESSTPKSLGDPNTMNHKQNDCLSLRFLLHMACR